MPGWAASAILYRSIYRHKAAHNPVHKLAIWYTVKSEEALLSKGLEKPMVPPSGLEPELLSEPHFECGASTNSAKGAYHGDQSNIIQGGAGQADRLDSLQSGPFRTSIRAVKNSRQ